MVGAGLFSGTVSSGDCSNFSVGAGGGMLYGTAPTRSVRLL
jgi:hypothetical protein